MIYWILIAAIAQSQNCHCHCSGCRTEPEPLTFTTLDQAMWLAVVGFGTYAAWQCLLGLIGMEIKQPKLLTAGSKVDYEDEVLYR